MVLRNDSASASALIADAVDTLLGDDWPLHLLTRDYARRVFAVAGARGWHGPQRNPPYGARWPVQTRTTEEIEQLAAPPELRLRVHLALAVRDGRLRPLHPAAIPQRR